MKKKLHVDKIDECDGVVDQDYVGLREAGRLHHGCVWLRYLSAASGTTASEFLPV